MASSSVDELALFSGEAVGASMASSSVDELALFSGEAVAAAAMGVSQPASSTALSALLISSRKDVTNLMDSSSCLLSESMISCLDATNLRDSASCAASASLSDLICSLSSASTLKDAGSASCTWSCTWSCTRAGSATGASVLGAGPEVDGFCCCCCCCCLFFRFLLFLLAAVSAVLTVGDAVTLWVLPVNSRNHVEPWCSGMGWKFGSTLKSSPRSNAQGISGTIQAWRIAPILWYLV